MASARVMEVVNGIHTNIVHERGRSADGISCRSKQGQQDGHGRGIDKENPSSAVSGIPYRSFAPVLPATNVGVTLHRDFVSYGQDGEAGRQLNPRKPGSPLDAADKSTGHNWAHVALQPTIRTATYGDVSRMVIGHSSSAATYLTRAILTVLHYCGVVAYEQHVEQISKKLGIGIMVVAIRGDEYEGTLHVDRLLAVVSHGLSLSYCLRASTFRDHIHCGRLSMQEMVYADCVWRFCSHFLRRRRDRQAASANERDAYLEEMRGVIYRHPRLIRTMYLEFAMTHYRGPGLPGDVLCTAEAHSAQASQVAKVGEKTDFVYGADDDFEHAVLSCFGSFNRAVLTTNFFLGSQAALSFRLDPDFLDPVAYPDRLHGMFFVCGAHFCGLHLRVCDVSRGGIRLVISQTDEAYRRNAKRFFDETYGLTLTQHRKNKDIAEGGAKGVILLDAGHQDEAKISFKEYIASLLDLLLPAEEKAADKTINVYGQAERLFMGPDENTASYVDWATEYARERGAPWWRSFFSGKSPRLGGIPHDTHGMTTLSVRQYVEGTYEKTGRVGTVRKMQTGGPDGDLGSNEILQSLRVDGVGKARELYVAIVDGTGVLADPAGLDRKELVRLARARLPIAQYNQQLLSVSGFRVLVGDCNVSLPTGELVVDGVTFRDTFHLRHSTRCDLFVPCGGRPGSIDLEAAKSLVVDGRCVIPCIVEGANLFVTQEARLLLERSGCILFKDASVNKGGVISSSYEALAALCLEDEEFVENMCVMDDGTEPPFYQRYVQQVKEIIQASARLEFNALWASRVAAGEAHSAIADDLSKRILVLSEEIRSSTVWSDLKFQRSVLEQAVPSVLVEKVGFWRLVERVSLGRFHLMCVSRSAYSPCSWNLLAAITSANSPAPFGRVAPSIAAQCDRTAKQRLLPKLSKRDRAQIILCSLRCKPG